MSRAYASVVDLSLDRKAGLLSRRTHHWAADVFIVAIVLHLLRIFTGARGGRAWAEARAR
jgi:ubiquinol-cytochrome c reductase cytochrome b subunit